MHVACEVGKVGRYDIHKYSISINRFLNLGLIASSGQDIHSATRDLLIFALQSVTCAEYRREIGTYLCTYLPMYFCGPNDLINK